MIRKRDAEAQNDGLGGSAARNALAKNASDAVNVLGAVKKGPKWADVRQRLEDKGVDTTVSHERDQEMRDILAAPEYQPLFTRIQETIRQNVLCTLPAPFTPLRRCTLPAPFTLCARPYGGDT